MTNWENEVQRHNSQLAERHQQEQLTVRMTAEQRRAELQRQHIERYNEVILPQFEILDQLDVFTSLREIRDQIWEGLGQVIKEPTRKAETSHEHNATYILESPPFYRNGDGDYDTTFYKCTHYIKVSTDLKEIIFETNMGKFSNPKIELKTSDYQSRKRWLRQQLTIGCTFDQSRFRNPIERSVSKEWWLLKALYEQYPEARRL